MFKNLTIHLSTASKIFYTLLFVFVLFFSFSNNVIADTVLDISSTTATQVHFNISFFDSSKYLRANYLYEGSYPDTSTEVCGNSNFNWRFDQTGYQYLYFYYPTAYLIPDECFVPYDGDFWFKMTDEGNNIGYFQFSILNGEVIESQPDYTTRLISTTPSDDATIATSSSVQLFFADLYVNTNDWNSSSRYMWSVYKDRKCVDKFCTTGVYVPSGNDYIAYENGPIISSGDLSLEIQSDTPLPVGEYFQFFTLTKGTNCILGYCLGNEIVYSTSTSFIVS